MFTYLLIFLFLGFLALIAQSRQALLANHFQSLRLNPLWWLLFIFLTFFIGLRHKVGGDWGSYAVYLAEMQETNFSDGLIMTGDPGYYLVNWLVSSFGLSIYAVNIFCGLIFSIGLVLLCRSLPRPLLALVAAFPYMVIVVAMGYSRQGVALGLAMIALVLLGREKRIWFIIFILFATSFHKTAFILLPIAALAATKNRFLILLWISIIGLTTYYSLLAESFDRLYLYYVTHTYSSQGALVRLMMLLIPSLLLIIWPHRFKFARSELILWRVVAFLSMGLFILYFFTDASTAVDRIALYMLPIQLVVFSFLPEFFGKRGALQQWIVIGVVLYFLVVLLVWLNFSPYSIYWQPYKNILFEFLP